MGGVFLKRTKNGTWKGKGFKKKFIISLGFGFVIQLSCGIMVGNLRINCMISCMSFKIFHVFSDLEYVACFACNYV